MFNKGLNQPSLMSALSCFRIPVYAGSGNAIHTVPSRLGALSASEREALMRKAKEAGLPRFNPAMAPQMGVMAMRMGAGGVNQGAAPAMQTGTATGEQMCLSPVQSIELLSSELEQFVGVSTAASGCQCCCCCCCCCWSLHMPVVHSGPFSVCVHIV